MGGGLQGGLPASEKHKLYRIMQGFHLRERAVGRKKTFEKICMQWYDVQQCATDTATYRLIDCEIVFCIYLIPLQVFINFKAFLCD